MTAEPVEFEVDGLTLRGYLYRASNPKKLAVLFLHGWTGITNEDAAKKLAENGFSSMTFSLSGHNNSEGKIEDQTRQKSLQEILAAYDLFKTKLQHNAAVGAAGSSYGSYMAAILSVERPLAFLSLKVPANYLDATFTKPQMGQGHEDPAMAQWRQQKMDYNSTRSLKAIHKFNGPVQVLEAEFDEILPHQCIQNYADAVSDKSRLDYHFMKDWTHGIGLNPERNSQYQEILLTWLKSIK